jgi:Rieske 2Fe-2S family protein
MEGPDRDRVVGEFKLMLDKVLAEDFSMVESLQNSTGAAGFTPGRMSRLERGVQHFVKHSIARLFGAPASARAPAALRASGEGG